MENMAATFWLPAALCCTVGVILCSVMATKPQPTKIEMTPALQFQLSRLGLSSVGLTIDGNPDYEPEQRDVFLRSVQSEFAAAEARAETPETETVKRAAVLAVAALVFVREISNPSDVELNGTSQAEWAFRMADAFVDVAQQRGHDPVSIMELTTPGMIV